MKLIFTMLLLCICSVVFGGELSIKDAEAFMEKAESELMKLSIESERAAWVAANFITFDSELIAARAGEERVNAVMKLAKEAAKFNQLKLPEDLHRKMSLLKLATTLPAPSDPALSQELAEVVSRLKSTYGKGKFQPVGSVETLTLGDLSQIMATSNDPKKLLESWSGWRTDRHARNGLFKTMAGSPGRSHKFQRNGCRCRY